MKKSLLLPFFLVTSLQAGFYFDVGPSFRLDWQNSKSFLTEGDFDPTFPDYERYNNVNVWEIAGEIKTDYCNPFYIGAQAKYGWVTQGTNSFRSLYVFDSDENFFELNRAQLSGHTYDMQIYAGFRLYIVKNKLSLIPCGGYEHHEKRYTQNHGTNNFNGLLDFATSRDNFFHKDHMRGPFAGFDFEWLFRKRLLVTGGFHWNFYKYSSLGTTRFTTEPTSTATHSYGLKTAERGYVGGPSTYLAANYNLNNCYFVQLKTSYYYTYLFNGHRHNDVFIQDYIDSDLTTQTLSENRLDLKNFDWSSWSIQLMLGLMF